MKTDAGMGKHGDGGEKTVIICASPCHRVAPSPRLSSFIPHPSSARPLSVSASLRPRVFHPSSLILHPSSVYVSDYIAIVERFRVNWWRLFDSVQYASVNLT